MPTPTAIERIPRPSRRAFIAGYTRPGRPVVIERAIEDWPARRAWTLDGLRARFGDRRVEVARTAAGRLVFSPRHGTPRDEVRFADFLDQLAHGQPEHYLIAPARERLAELLEDVRVPDFCPPARWRHSRFWLGPRGTVSPLHRDLTDNLLAQVTGRKRVILYDRRERRRMYAYPPWSQVPNFSRVDAEAPDLARFPRFSDARAFACEIGPGDVLYIPRLWWHQVRAIDTSCSLNLWWASGAVYPLVLAALAVARLRGLRY